MREPFGSRDTRPGRIGFRRVQQRRPGKARRNLLLSACYTGRTTPCRRGIARKDDKLDVILSRLAAPIYIYIYIHTHTRACTRGCETFVLRPNEILPRGRYALTMPPMKIKRFTPSSRPPFLPRLPRILSLRSVFSSSWARSSDVASILTYQRFSLTGEIANKSAE